MATTTGAVTAAAATGSLGQEAYERLLTELISLEITPGERLSVDALARRYRISQTPIREALARLESDGLVIKTHLRGFTAAAGFSRREFTQLFDIRLLLEPYAAGQAALHRSAEQAAALQELADRMRVGVPDPAAGTLLDGQFHDLVATAAGNPLVRESLTRLHAHLHLARVPRPAGDAAPAATEHECVVAAIVTGDRHNAEAAMRSHLERARDRLTRALDLPGPQRRPAATPRG